CPRARSRVWSQQARYFFLGVLRHSSISTAAQRATAISHLLVMTSLVSVYANHVERNLQPPAQQKFIKMKTGTSLSVKPVHIRTARIILAMTNQTRLTTNWRRSLAWHTK